MSSSIVKSPPALHLGSLGELGGPLDAVFESFVPCELAAGGTGGALGAIYVSLNCCCGAEGRLGARLGGTNSSLTVPGSCNANGPEIDFPFTVGVSPDVSDEETDEGEVSAPDEELMELMVFFTAPEAISFLGIDLLVPAESIRFGIGGLLASDESVVSASSLILESCDDLGVPVLSVVSNCRGESAKGVLTVASL